MNIKFSENNFDLLRLFAAFQVVLSHVAGHLDLEVRHSALWSVVKAFPGVPIFFFMSGFLISRSWEKNGVLRDYFLNRFLRLYPGLWVCVLSSLIMIVSVGYFSDHQYQLGTLLTWIFAQCSIVQFWNPDFFREFGVGVVNGSLWTICVELQFYCIIPFFYLVLGKFSLPSRNYVMATLIVFFGLLNAFYFARLESLCGRSVYKFIGVTFLPWLYMFLIGVWAQMNFEKVLAFILKHRIHVCVFFLTLGWICQYGEVQLGNSLPFWYFLPLASFILLVAYSWTGLSKKLLKGNDISYGVYIYHMPILNCFIYKEVSKGYSFVFVIISCVLMALLSWLFVEKTSLSLKRKPLRGVV